MAKSKPEASQEENAGQAVGSKQEPSNTPQEMVQIPKETLTEILKKLERLEFATDKGRLEHFDNANKPKELTRVRLNAYEEATGMPQKVVMAWRMVIDEAGYNSFKGYFENQVIELTLEDDTKVSVPYKEFSVGRKRKQQPAEILSRSKEEGSDNEIFTVRRVADGKQYKVDSRFIN